MSTMLAGSSGNDDIRTPRDLFERLNRAFRFDYDAFASHENHLIRAHSTIAGTYYGTVLADARTGLTYPWEGLRVYGTRWWQLLAQHAHIDYLPKRVKYEHPNPPKGWSGASFPSAVAIMKKDWL